MERSLAADAFANPLRDTDGAEDASSLTSAPALAVTLLVSLGVTNELVKSPEEPPHAVSTHATAAGPSALLTLFTSLYTLPFNIGSNVQIALCLRHPHPVCRIQ